MAIQVGGTTVVDDSRNLQNVGGLKTVGGIAILGSGDVPVGVGAPNFDPTSTPNVTLTSSGSWNKPGSLGANDWVIFYMLAGGGGGSFDGTWGHGGSGASAALFAALAGSLPSSISFTVGAGGTSNQPGNDGGATTASINGRLYTAFGGRGGGKAGTFDATPPSGPGYYTLPFGGQSPLDYASTTATGGTAGFYGGTGTASIFGGGAGLTLYGGSAATSSTYAGSGGSNANGGVPSGGGSGSYGGSGYIGGRGEVRIYYV